jgi:hypothetical protein
MWWFREIWYICACEQSRLKYEVEWFGKRRAVPCWQLCAVEACVHASMPGWAEQGAGELDHASALWQGDGDTTAWAANARRAGGECPWQTGEACQALFERRVIESSFPGGPRWGCLGRYLLCLQQSARCMKGMQACTLHTLLHLRECKHDPDGGTERLRLDSGAASH